MLETPQSVTAQRPDDCLAGGGDMGALMRARDWGATALGPVATWPQSLRTAISMMLESRFAMVVAWGPEFRFFYNDRYRPVLGATKHPAALGTPAEVIFPEAWPFIGPLFNRTRAGEAIALDDQLIPLDRNGYLENCYFTLSYSPIRDESGGVGGMLAVVAETTERVQGERRLATLRNLLRAASEARSVEGACERAARILGQNPVDVPFALVYVVDGAGERARLVAAEGIEPGGAAAPESLDLREEGGVAWPVAEAVRSRRLVVVPDAARRFGPLPGGPYPEPAHAAVVVPLARPGLAHPYALLVAGVSPRRALDDAYQVFFDLAADHVLTAIGNARALEEEHRRAEALAELDRAKTAFFSNVSHEFRTPLTLILGPTQEALRGGAALAPGERERLEAVHRNALRLLKLVNSLLEFSRIEAGRAQATFAPADLARLTSEAGSAFQSLVEQAGLRYRVACPPLPEPFYVDAAMWERIVLNLVSNAFKHTFAGEIAVTLEAVEGGARLTVSDTGTGIAPEHLPRIFERFYRVEDARGRSHEGSGIGLALVRDLVRLHGGTVSAESAPGRGSRFTVFLPRGHEHLAPEAAAAAARRATPDARVAEMFVEEASSWGLRGAAPEPEPLDVPAAAGVHLGARILVADDNADMRGYLARILAPLGEVEVARDGVEALEAVRRAAPEVVVTDVMMPNLDGFGLLRALRQDPQASAIPVVMVSARAGEESRAAGIEGGADDYLAKPFSARELFARVRAQVALGRARRASEAERARMYAIFEEAPVPICVMRGEDLVFELANPTYRRLVGDRALVGRTLLEALPEVAGQGYDALLREVMRTRKAHVAREGLLRLARGPGGALEDTFWTFIYAPLADPDGRSCRAMVVCNEVTEQVRARSAAEEASRTKDEFLAMLGHELRNPLAPILTALHLMRARGQLGKEAAIIERQVRHLAHLVDDLLDVSRIASGKVTLQRERLDVADVLARALEMSSPLFEARGQRLEVDVPRGLALQADASRLAQVFSNLLTNASKYGEVGGYVQVRAHREGGVVRVSVRDDGIGISPALLPHVFDLFVQGRQHLDRARGGLGLGLSIVKNLVQLHGGRVEARSDGAGRGSEFLIELPATDAGDEQPRRDAAARPRAAPSRGRRVLLVDDNRDAARTLSAALTLLGHEVRIAHDGPHALRVAGSFVPHAAVLDIGLPVMDGYELAAELQRVLPGIRLVAVTGYGLASDRRRSVSAGFVEHLVKPVDVAVVSRLLSDPGAPADGELHAAE